MELTQVRELCQRIKENVQRVIVGKDEVIDMMLTAMIARGHILLEDVPGTGKTVTAKALAKSIECSFKRIQFTPDILPSDVTGISIYDQRSGTFEWKPGPIFAGLVLADEINRATPRTQSALLECMEERQVTEGGTTRALPEPFLVVATQNPIEIQGTFPLPEAQLDRFFMKLRMGYPTNLEAKDILSRFLADDPLSELKSVATTSDIVEAQKALSQVKVHAVVQEYIVAVVERTRVMEDVLLGASPRASLALMRACQVWALLQGRPYVLPDDVKKLAKPVLCHRMVMRTALLKAGQSESAMDDVLRLVHAPTEKLD